MANSWLQGAWMGQFGSGRRGLANNSLFIRIIAMRCTLYPGHPMGVSWLQEAEIRPCRFIGLPLHKGHWRVGFPPLLFSTVKQSSLFCPHEHKWQISSELSASPCLLLLFRIDEAWAHASSCGFSPGGRSIRESPFPVLPQAHACFSTSPALR